MRFSATLSLCAALVVAAPAAAEDRVSVLVYDGYGTPSALRVWGRVLEEHEPPPVDGKADSLTNAAANLGVLESDEVEDALVRVRVRGIVLETRSDDDGMWEVRLEGLPALKKTGPLPVRASLPGIAGSEDGLGQVWTHDPAAATCVVSDVDDTIVRSHVTERLDMIWHALTVNAAQKQATPGIAEAYRRAQEAGASAFFYVSGSPQNFYERIEQFLILNDLPRGPLLLKNYGSDATFDQEAYKLGRIRGILDFYPGMQCVLVGDSGERDAAIYRQIRTEYPGRVRGIVIHEVEGAPLASELRDGVTVVKNFARMPEVIAAMVREEEGRP